MEHCHLVCSSRNGVCTFDKNESHIGYRFPGSTVRQILESNGLLLILTAFSNDNFFIVRNLSNLSGRLRQISAFSSSQLYIKIQMWYKSVQWKPPSGPADMIHVTSHPLWQVHFWLSSIKTLPSPSITLNLHQFPFWGREENVRFSFVYLRKWSFRSMLHRE